MSKRTVIITAVSDCRRGEPITSTRPYGCLPLLNRPLLFHQLETLENGKAEKFVILVNEKSETRLRDLVGKKHDVSFLPIENEKEVEEAIAAATLIVPGDLLLKAVPDERQGPLLLLTKGSSEEEGATKALLTRLGLVEKVAHLEADAFRIDYPWELISANQALCKGLEGQHVHPSVVREENVILNGAVTVGKGTVLKANTYIEGPVVIGEGCEIGPFCHLRPETCIADGCRIGKSEVVDSILLERVTSKHVAYIGHSVLGADVNIGAFTVTADYRHDGKTHVTLFHGDRPEKVDTGRRKLGAFLGDKVHTAISTSVYPGRKIWPGLGTLPGEVVKEDKRL